MRWTSITTSAALAGATRLTHGAVTLLKDDAGTWHAVASRCPHMGYPMEKGTLRDGVLTCAWHRWEFDLASGGCYRGACADLPVYPLRILDGRVEVQLDEQRATVHALLRAQLSDRLIEGDRYQLARTLAEGLEQGLSPRELASVVCTHGIAHAIVAHPSAGATQELAAVVAGARLAEGAPGRDRILPLLQGSLGVGNNVGARRAVVPLPGHPPLPERLTRLAQYVDEASSLAVERLLLDWPEDPQRDARLVGLSLTPRFLPNPQVPLTTIEAIDLVQWLGDEPACLPILIGWILGAPREDPPAEERAAIRWLETAALPTTASGTGPCAPEALEAVYGAPEGTAALETTLALVRAHSAQAVILAFLVQEARRLARLRPNNGGLWDSAVLGIRLAEAVLRVLPGLDEPTRALAACHLAAHAFRTRWLPLGHAHAEPPAPQATAEAYAHAIAHLEVAPARAQAVALAGAIRASGGSWWPLVAPLLAEDLSGERLRLIDSCLRALPQLEEWQPLVAGLVTFALDGRSRQDVAAAARFGRSMLRPGAGGPAAIAEA